MGRWGVVAGLVAVAAVAALALSGCGGSDDASGASTAATAGGGPLDGRWELTDREDAGAMVAIPAGVTVDAVFADGRVSGGAGVNSYSGAYKAGGGGELLIGPVAATQMAGPPAAMAVEGAYLAALEAVRAYTSDGETLTMLAAGDRPLLTFAARAASPAGAWEVTGFNNGRQAVVSPVAGSTLTARFGADGAVTGDAGVNTYRADYATTAPDGIRISAPAATRKAGPQELMDQEAEFLAALESAATFSVRGGLLELRDGSDAIAVTMSRR